MTKNCFSSAMVFIVDEGLMTAFETGTITAVFYIVYAIIQVLGGFLTDKRNPEIFITLGLIGAGICNILIYFFNTSYIAVLLIWSLNAIIQAPFWPATFKIISTMLHPCDRQKGLLIATLGSPLGMVASYGVAAIIPTWQVSFLISGFGLFAFAIYWQIAFLGIKPRLLEDEIEHIDYGQSAKKEDKGLFALMLSSGLLFILIVTLIRCMFDIGIKSLTPTMINACYENISPTLATALNIIVLVSGVFGPFVAQIIYPRLIRNEMLACAVFFLAALPLTVVISFVGRINYWFIIIALALMVMFISAAGLFTTSLVAAKFNKWGKGATVAGILNCLAALGIVAANFIFTALAEGTGWSFTTGVWIIMVAVGTALCFVSVPIWKRFSKNS